MLQFKVLTDPDATVGIPLQEAKMDRAITPGPSYPLGEGSTSVAVSGRNVEALETLIVEPRPFALSGGLLMFTAAFPAGSGRRR